MRCRWFLALALIWGTLTHQACASRKVTLRGAQFRNGPISLRLLSEGRRLPVFALGGRLYVPGRRHATYQIQLRNHTGLRLEVFVAVDGRDVITGQVARPKRQRGYILLPYRTVVIPGFRTSQWTVAAFRFSSPAKALAAQRGSASEIGQIRALVFQEDAPSLLLPRLSRNSEPPQPDPQARLSGRTRKPAKRKDSNPVVSNRASGTKRSRRRPTPTLQPGLGTAQGARIHAPVRAIPFVRSPSPIARLLITYDHCEGLARRGVTGCAPQTLLRARKGRSTVR